MTLEDQVSNMSINSNPDSLLETTANHRKSRRREERSYCLSDSADGEDGHQDEDEDIAVDTEGDPDQEVGSHPSPASPTPIKRPKRNPSVKCPICHEIVAPGLYQQHYKMELTQLEACVSNENLRGKRGAAIAATKQFTKGRNRGSASDNEKRGMLKDIQKRRTARQNNKDNIHTGLGQELTDIDLGLGGSFGDALAGNDSPAHCFICSERLFGTLDDINSHIDACLANPQPAHHGHNSSGASTPVSGGASGRSSVAADSFEEYTWAGQTRVRATALFEGSMRSLGSGTRSAQEDIDDDLNVEDDEDDEYGGAQFSERDVVMDDIDPDAGELREIVLESSMAVQRVPTSDHTGEPHRPSSSRQNGKGKNVIVGRDNGNPHAMDDDMDDDEEIDLEGIDEEDEKERVDALINAAFASGDTKLVIEALRSKIKHLESANKSVPSCLICLEPYTVPLTSIVCWHVHCEACWMKTLGSKKLCPQCQKITLPKDLRRIYL
ncbi:hypothetical protein B0O80DRAFT_435898 [Mortierella sp. GBAus27b]|nr:hypothetical protein BGX31_009817 [Mortierella sp. GBA43]KAI8362440.1 hypothetical protein B0O80DRAFT_435898 [Mortierella sp. GBAus27b]